MRAASLLAAIPTRMRQIHGGRGDLGGLAEIVLAVVELVHPVDIGEDEIELGVLDPGRQAPGGLEEGLVGGSFAHPDHGRGR